MPATKKKTSLYDRLGGDAALAAAVDGFYERVLRDPSLRPFFKTTNIERLKSQQRDFLAEALGGPPRYEGLDMQTAHRGMGIERRHFNRVAEHLEVSLRDLAVGSR